MQSMKLKAQAQQIEISSLKLEIKELNDSNEKSKEQIERLNAQVASAEPNEKQELYAKILDLEHTINTKDIEIDALKLQGDNAKVQKKIEEVIRNFDEKIKELQDLQDDSNAKFNNHVKIIQENKTKIQELEQTITKNDLEYQKAELDLTATIDQLRKTNESLEGDLKKSNADALQEYGKFNKQIAELKETIGTQEEDIKSLKSTIAAHEKTRDEQVQTIKTGNEKIAQQEKEVIDLNEAIKNIQETNKQIEEGRKQYQTKFESANTDLHKMTQLRDKLQAQINANTTDGAMKVLQDQVNDLTRENGDLDKKINALNHEVDKLQTQLASRSSSDDHRKDANKSKSRKTDAEHKAEFQSKNRELLQELLKQLRKQVDIPVDKPPV